MEFLILEGDMIVYSDDRQGMKQGDLILYHSHGRIVCHRLYFVTPFALITAGDNCHQFEGISHKNYVGRLSFVIRDSARYALNADVSIKKKYVRFMMSFIVRTYFMRQKSEAFFLDEKYLKLAQKRNELQQAYLKLTRL